MEPDKMSKSDIAKLNCINDFGVWPIQYRDKGDRNNEIYKMFGEIVGQDINFIWCWLRMFFITNKKYVVDLAKPYFRYKGINFVKWLADVQTDQRADVLCVFLLSKITKTHTVIHLNEQRYWSTIKDEPTEHKDFIQCTNLHLAYAGRNIFVQLVDWEASLHYKIFGAIQP